MSLGCGPTSNYNHVVVSIRVSSHLPALQSNLELVQVSPWLKFWLDLVFYIFMHTNFLISLVEFNFMCIFYGNFPCIDFQFLVILNSPMLQFFQGIPVHTRTTSSSIFDSLLSCLEEQVFLGGTGSLMSASGSVALLHFFVEICEGLVLKSSMCIL